MKQFKGIFIRGFINLSVKILLHKILFIFRVKKNLHLFEKRNKKISYKNRKNKSLFMEDDFAVNKPVTSYSNYTNQLHKTIKIQNSVLIKII